MSADPRRADPLDELRVLVDEPSFAQHVCRCVFQLKNAKDAFKRASWRCDFSGNFELQQDECDQIGRFITLWATFQSLWQQLFCPNRSYFQANFVQVSSFIFLVKSFCPTFTDIWLLFTSHTAWYQSNKPPRLLITSRILGNFLVSTAPDS